MQPLQIEHANDDKLKEIAKGRGILRKWISPIILGSYSQYILGLAAIVFEVIAFVSIHRWTITVPDSKFQLHTL
jgi:hypothetical protein